MLLSASPGALQRRCVQLEHRTQLLEQRLVRRDAERIELLRHSEQLRGEAAALRGAAGERDALRAKAAELGRMCKQLLRERSEGGSRAAADRAASAAREEEAAREAERWRLRAAELQEALRRQEARIDRRLEGAHRPQPQQQQRGRSGSAGGGTARRSFSAGDGAALSAAARAPPAPPRCTDSAPPPCPGRPPQRAQEADQARQVAVLREAQGCLEEEVRALCSELARSRAARGTDSPALLHELRAAEGRDGRLAESVRRVLAAADSAEARRLADAVLADLQSGARAEAGALRRECAALAEAAEEAERDRGAQRERYARLAGVLQRQREAADEQCRGSAEEVLALNNENREVVAEYTRVRGERDDARARCEQAEDAAARLREAAAAAGEAHAAELRQLRARLLEAEGALSRRPAQSAAASQTEGDPTAAEAAAAAAGGRERELQARERRVEAREAELAGRERALALREADVERAAAAAERAAAAAAAAPAPAAEAVDETRLEALLRQSLGEDAEAPVWPPAPQCPPPACPGGPAEGQLEPPRPGAAEELLAALCRDLHEAAGGQARLAAYLAAQRGAKQVASRSFAALPPLPEGIGGGALLDALAIVADGAARATREAQEHAAWLATELEVLRRGAAQQPQQPGRHLGGERARGSSRSPSSASSTGDLGRCSEMVADSDALLRAAQGQPPYWGTERIAALERELRELELIGEGEEGDDELLVRADGSPAPQPPRRPPPAGSGGGSSRRRARWPLGASPGP
eukprot:TRINITY_DN8355_c0_g4_i1.p1 TRINITY_DN8355_c0_g4~~TRINITY_DN8355_c0_g4_i1.p1  ORF type:complete len:785 (+),score=311.32 TRINITY_DN8355_c0_g4_i1:76-2355(+)